MDAIEHALTFPTGNTPHSNFVVKHVTSTKESSRDEFE